MFEFHTIISSEIDFSYLINSDWRKMPGCWLLVKRMVATLAIEGED